MAERKIKQRWHKLVDKQRKRIVNEIFIEKKVLNVLLYFEPSAVYASNLKPIWASIALVAEQRENELIDRIPVFSANAEVVDGAYSNWWNTYTPKECTDSIVLTYQAVYTEMR